MSMELSWNPIIEAELEGLVSGCRAGQPAHYDFACSAAAARGSYCPFRT
jgi:hypothetical protein